MYPTIMQFSEAFCYALTVLSPPVPSPAPYSVTLLSQKTNIELQVLDFRTRSLVTRSSHTSSQRARYFLLFPSETRATVNKNSIKFSAKKENVEFHCRSLKVAQNLDLFQRDAQCKHWHSAKVVAECHYYVG